MKEMMKLEKLFFELQWAFNKLVMKIVSKIGLLKTEVTPYKDGTLTTYRNRKGEIVFEVKEWTTR